MNKAILDGLLRVEKEDRLHHAYILSGPAASSKLETVLAFALELFPGGRDSPGAQRLLRTGHSDYVVIEPKEDSIRVDDVRELPKLLAYPPLEMRKRLVVIKEADLLNVQASNAFLKILEEPPSHTVFFLLTNDAELLLQTIRSRCQTLRFPPMKEKELLTHLSQGGMAQEKLVHAVRWAEGSLERAQEFLSHEDRQLIRGEALLCLCKLWQASPRIPSECLRIVDTWKESAQLGLALDSLYAATRDIAMLVNGGEKFPLYHEDSRDKLQQLAAQLVSTNKNSLDALLRELTEKCEGLHRLRVSLGFNVNQKLALDGMVSDLQLFSIGKSR